MEVLRVLKKGGVIAFPTDTVYGIGCDAFNEKAIEKIYKIKKRERSKPLVLFLKDKEQLKNYIKRAPAFAEKIIERFWPGTLTLVFRAKKNAPLQRSDGTIGIRIPNHKAILKILEYMPLATTSCNYTTSTPALKPEDINIDGISYVIKGKSLSDIPSTVFSIPDKTILRKGIISIYDIEKAGSIRVRLAHGLKFCVLFVCGANLCRSPMAEGIFKKIIQNSIRQPTDRIQNLVEVISCGTNALIDEHPTRYAIEVMDEIGGRTSGRCNISSLRARSLTRDLILRADIILTMEQHHKYRVLDILKQAESKTRVLGINDPIGQTRNFYRKVRDELLSKLRPIVKEVRNKITIGE